MPKRKEAKCQKEKRLAKIGPAGLRGGPGPLQDGPAGLRAGHGRSKMPKESAKSASRRSQTCPRPLHHAQDSMNMAQEAPKTPQEGSKRIPKRVPRDKNH